MVSGTPFIYTREMSERDLILLKFWPGQRDVGDWNILIKMMNYQCFKDMRLKPTCLIVARHAQYGPGLINEIFIEDYHCHYLRSGIFNCASMRGLFSLTHTRAHTHTDQWKIRHYSRSNTQIQLQVTGFYAFFSVLRKIPRSFRAPHWKKIPKQL